jgi:hypothetical protein
MAETTHVVIGKRVEELPCVLTDAEVRECADLLATNRKRQRQVERRKSLAMNDFKTTLAEIDDSIDSLAESIKSQKTTRAVDCEERAFPELGKAVLVRLDTQAEVRSRTLTARELEKLLGNGVEEKPVVDPDGDEGKDAGAGAGSSEKPEKPEKGKGKGKSKKKLGPGGEPAVAHPSWTAKPGAATKTAEQCPHPDCTLPVEHDGPHVVATPASDPSGDEAFD